MMKNNQQPSPGQIIWTDYTAFLLSILPLVAWVVYLAWAPDWRGDGPLLSPAVAPVFLVIAIITTILGVGVVAWRIFYLRSIFRRGSQARGRISSFSMRRDRGRVQYAYFYDHKEYISGTSVHRNKQTLKIKQGDRVILMVDQANPKRAFIRDLYL